MTPSFLAGWKLLIINEGGYVNSPEDSGHATMYGITEVVARASGYLGDMRSLTLDQAQQIAYNKYWVPFNCDLFSTPVAFQILDTAYNGGHPVQWLQEIIGGTQTGQDLADVVGFVNVWEVIARFNAKRLAYLASLKQPVYADGRMNRISNNLQQGDLQ